MHLHKREGEAGTVSPDALTFVEVYTPVWMGARNDHLTLAGLVRGRTPSGAVSLRTNLY